MPAKNQQIMLASSDLISLTQASRLTPYSAEYLGLLARKGKFKAIKISRDWLTTPKAVLWYVKKQEVKHGQETTGQKRSFRRAV